MLTAEELAALTVAQLKRVAGDLGITLTATRKADIIVEILDGGEAVELPTPSDEIPIETAGG